MANVEHLESFVRRGILKHDAIRITRPHTIVISAESLFDDVALQTDLTVVHIVSIAIHATRGDLEDEAGVALVGNLGIGTAVHHTRALVGPAVATTCQRLATGNVDGRRWAVANLETGTGEGRVASELFQLSDIARLTGRSPPASWGMVNGRGIGVGQRSIEAWLKGVGQRGDPNATPRGVEVVVHSLLWGRRGRVGKVVDRLSVFDDSLTAVAVAVNIQDGARKGRRYVSLLSPTCKGAGVAGAVLRHVGTVEGRAGVGPISLICASLVDVVGFVAVGRLVIPSPVHADGLQHLIDPGCLPVRLGRYGLSEEVGRVVAVDVAALAYADRPRPPTTMHGILVMHLG